MPRRTAEDDEPDPPEEDAAEDEEPSGPPRARRGVKPRHRSLKAWEPGSRARPPSTEGRPPSEEPDEEVDDGPAPGWRHRVRRPVYFRARDTVWFEPLIALAIIVLLLVSLYAYTGNWPPAYVVESDSMQHGSTDQIGLINTGDLVLAQQLGPAGITTYVQGVSSGYKTYGEFGDVLLYHPNDDLSVAPIIHRAIVYLEWNANATYSAPSLAGLPCGSAAGAVYRVSSHPDGCGTAGLSGTLTLLGIGWTGATVSVNLDPSALGRHAGYLTMGDNNVILGSPPVGEPDQPSLSTLVETGWIVGLARGMIPWFGALKLLIDGNAGMVPTQSWEWLGLTVIGILLVAMGVHYVLRAEGIEDERRKEEEGEEGEEERSHRWRPLLAWRSRRDAEEDEEDDVDGEPRRAGRPRPSRAGGEAPRRKSWGGRPRPSVGRAKPRSASSRRKAGRDDDL
jgi:signal peptidase I